MIRFRTIDPAEAGTPAPQPAAAPPLAGNPATEIAEGVVAGRPKGLTRKTPLRAKKPAPAPAPLLDE